MIYDIIVLWDITGYNGIMCIYICNNMYIVVFHSDYPINIIVNSVGILLYSYL